MVTQIGSFELMHLTQTLGFNFVSYGPVKMRLGRILHVCKLPANFQLIRYNIVFTVSWMKAPIAAFHHYNIIMILTDTVFCFFCLRVLAKNKLILWHCLFLADWNMDVMKTIITVLFMFHALLKEQMALSLEGNDWANFLLCSGTSPV